MTTPAEFEEREPGQRPGAGSAPRAPGVEDDPRDDQSSEPGDADVEREGSEDDTVEREP